MCVDPVNLGVPIEAPPNSLLPYFPFPSIFFSIFSQYTIHTENFYKFNFLIKNKFDCTTLTTHEEEKRKSMMNPQNILQVKKNTQ